MKQAKAMIVWSALRLSLGFIFICAFLDKIFGLGYATESSKSWLTGNSLSLADWWNSTSVVKKHSFLKS